MDELTYNGRQFSEFNTFFDGSKAFGTPEKDYELVEIMGRNGSLSIYNDRFKDIALPFPCFIRTGFLTHFRDLTEFLNSQEGYLRLETSKEPNHFRMALFQGIVEPQTTAFNHGGQFTINFLAHPERWLKSGETPVSVSSTPQTYTGNPISIDIPSGVSTVNSLAVALNPVQAGSGDPSPTNIRPITGHSEVTVEVTDNTTTETYSLSLGQTVYGGTVDLATGLLTVSHITHTIDPQRINSVTVLGTNVRSGLYSPEGFIPSTGENALAISNLLPRVTKNYSADVTGFYFYNATGIYIKLPVASLESSDLTGFRKFLTDNPMEVVYPLGTPTTVQLTPQQISLLTGINVISSDGDMTISVSEPSLLVNPTLFPSKPLIRVYGNGTVNINNQYITIAENPFPYIDIDCEMMDCFYGSSNANSYVRFSTDDYVTLRSGNNYIVYDGTVIITPRWYEI